MVPEKKQPKPKKKAIVFTIEYTVPFEHIDMEDVLDKLREKGEVEVDANLF